MRILVGYDGSVPADGALFDLGAGGLPEKAEALVISAVAPWMPYGPGGDPAAEGWGVEPSRIKDYSRQALAEGQATAERGARYLRDRFPGWDVKAAAVVDDAAHGILERAGRWKADLIVLGTPDRSVLGRLLRGSVTQKVLHHAPCDVRVGRGRLVGRRRAPVLLLAWDGSAGSERAMAALISRTWPRGTEVRVTAVVDHDTAKGEAAERELALGLLPGRSGHGVLRNQALSWIERKVEAACASLSAAGLRAVPSVLAGEPRRVLLAEAKEFGVACVFMGSRGLNPVERFTLGSVSGELAAHAPCTVEVVRSMRQSMRMSARKRMDRSDPKKKSIRQR